ncbi:hypothetical protein PMAYCL1PPCAC_20820, partial [Pristionchus mayeri]
LRVSLDSSGEKPHSCYHRGISFNDKSNLRRHMLSIHDNKGMTRHKCVVCQRLCNRNEMRSFTMDLKRRTTWINAVRSTPEGRRALMKQLNATTHIKYLCENHFLP